MISPEVAFAFANTEDFVRITGPTTGKEFNIRRFTYGVLVPDENSPLSCVSVANSSLSVDVLKGCPLLCRYCHLQGTRMDLNGQGRMEKTQTMRSRFTAEEVIDALVQHPYFVPNRSIISIGTSSTEPFMPGLATETTFSVMREFIKRELRNPFWIVTKGGVPKDREVELKEICRTNKLMLSLCWAGNPPHIEPAQNGRFNNAEMAKRAGAVISWYMRPLAVDWGASREHIEGMMQKVVREHPGVIDVIVPGGLRYTEGIQYGLEEVYKIEMPNISHNDNKKDLPERLYQDIVELAGRYFPSVPVYLKSSCALTYMLGVPSITSVQTMARDACKASLCSVSQRQICRVEPLRHASAKRATAVRRELGIPAEPPLTEFTYAIQRAFIKEMAADPTTEVVEILDECSDIWLVGGAARDGKTNTDVDFLVLVEDGGVDRMKRYITEKFNVGGRDSDLRWIDDAFVGKYRGVDVGIAVHSKQEVSNYLRKFSEGIGMEGERKTWAIGARLPECVCHDMVVAIPKRDSNDFHKQMLKLVTPYPEKAREVLLNYLIEEIKTKTFSAQRAIHQGDVLVSAVAVGDISLALVRMAFATEKKYFPNIRHIDPSMLDGGGRELYQLAMQLANSLGNINSTALAITEIQNRMLK